MDQEIAAALQGLETNVDPSRMSMGTLQNLLNQVDDVEEEEGSRGLFRICEGGGASSS